MLRDLKAVGILGLYAFFAIAGTPVLDSLDLAEGGEGEGAGGAAVQRIIAFNARFREPIASRLDPVQKVFRIAQSWALYRDGPFQVRRLEIRVDGELVHRSVDPEHPWLEDRLANRHLRPVLESTAMSGRKSKNWLGLSRWIVAEARAQWPGCSRVELTFTSSPYPGKEPTPSHRIVAVAPAFTPTFEAVP